MVLSYHTCRTVTRKLSMFPAYSPDDLPFEFFPLAHKTHYLFCIRMKKARPFTPKERFGFSLWATFIPNFQVKSVFLHRWKKTIWYLYARQKRPDRTAAWSSQEKERRVRPWATATSSCSGRAAEALRQTDRRKIPNRSLFRIRLACTTGSSHSGRLQRF